MKDFKGIRENNKEIECKGKSLDRVEDIVIKIKGQKIKLI